MFENIIGQESIKNKLEYIVDSKNITNAYIFSGPEGVGKSMIAKEFASELIGIDVENSSDFVLIEPEKGENSIKIDKIRNINSNINLKPFSKYRIFLIDDADKMTHQAQNALLKTLEEPSSYGIIILVTKNEQSLLETIRSRCMEIKFSPISLDKVEDFLINKSVEKNLAKVSAILSRGSIGRAVELSTREELVEIRAMVKVILDNTINKKDLFETTRISEYIKSYTNQIQFFIEVFKLYIRDLIVYRETSNRDLVINKDDIDFIKKMSFNINTAKLGKVIDILDDTEKKLSANCNFNSTINAMANNFYEVVNK